MVWIFERAGESFELETQYDEAASEFVIIIHGVKGRPQIERFAEPSAFRARVASLEHQLHSDNWLQRGPIFLQDAWKV